jgi:fermentation-respiration switch protein FrsA (DUF1100 family)
VTLFARSIKSMTTERFTVTMPGGDVAIELHRTVGASVAALAVFVPGAPRDASLTRAITSAWESAIVAKIARSDIAFVTLNYLGVGKSTGRMADSSIADRRAQVAAVVRFARAATKPRRLVFIACSMGGHIAARLTAECNPDGMALVIPAAYSLRAETLNFGPDLTSELRRPYSWRNSPAFTEYRAFTGRKLLIAPQDDEVIPAEITGIYRDCTDTAFVWRPTGVGHRFLACTTARERSVTRESIERVAAFVQLCADGTNSEGPPNTEEGAAA